MQTDTACGVLFGALCKRYDTIAQFTAFENFCSFNKKGKNKIKRVENHKIKATATHYEVGCKVRKAIEDIGGTMPENTAKMRQYRCSIQYIR